MKYMLIMRATDKAFAEFANVDFNEILESMGRFNDEMISAGVLVAAEGLADASEGVVVDYSSKPPVVTDGPYGETKELFGGYWIVDVASQEEAVEWAKRAPMAGPGVKTEIRRIQTLKYCPAFPGRFGSIEDARSFCAAFFDHYNHVHRHAGIGLHTPASVHYGTAGQIRAHRAVTLNAGDAANPARFGHRRPHPPKLPTVAWINEPSPEALIKSA